MVSVTCESIFFDGLTGSSDDTITECYALVLPHFVSKLPLCMLSRSGKLVVWVASLDIIMVRILMLHLAFLKQLKSLVCSVQWNQLSTMLRIILLRHDGG